MKRYIVLQSLAPDQGLPVHPAGPDQPPVTVDATFFRGETDEERAPGIARLIALGVIAPAPEPTTTTTRNEKPAKEA